MKDHPGDEAATADSQQSEDNSQQHRIEDLMRNHVNDAEAHRRQQDRCPEAALPTRLEARQQETAESQLFTDCRSDGNRQQWPPPVHIRVGERFHELGHLRRKLREEPVELMNQFHGDRLQYHRQHEPECEILPPWPEELQGSAYTTGQ